MILDIIVILFLVVMGVVGIALTIGYYKIYVMQYELLFEIYNKRRKDRE